MAIELTPLAPLTAARPADRAGAGNRADDDQDGGAGGFSSALDEARTASADAAPETRVGDDDAAHSRRRKQASDKAVADAATGDTTGLSPAAAAGTALAGLAAATGTAAGAATAAGTAAIGKVGATGGKNAKAAPTDSAGTASAPGKQGLATAGAGIGAESNAAATATAKSAAPGTAQATQATQAAAKTDATASTAAPVVPVAASEAVAPTAVLPPHPAPPALAQDSDGVPGYQSNFARMQQALAHAPAGGKGAAADATQSAAQDLGATVTNVALGTPAGKAVASTVSLGENAPTRLSATVADLVAAGPRVAEAAGAGRSGESGGHAARDGQGDSGAGAAGSAATLGFGATAALDSSGWNSGFASAATAATTDAAVDGGMRSAEDLLADRIGNWVHQKTQSAELTLDAFGGSPVDVRISMTGSEAHVAFQSGSAETRQLLGGAVDQLRELLQSQGLVLSGMSVGGSDTPQGNGQAGAREGGGSRGRSATPAVERTADVATAARSAPVASQRAVDVFI
jgi:flagellar hook-length control protein FliK